MCVRGASALQDVLTSSDGVPLHVFVVWEPVLVSDLAPPTTTVLGLIHDSRAEQYWDRELSLSKDLLRTALSDPRRYDIAEELAPDALIWDVVALFPPRALWDRDVPVPVYYGHTVLESAEGLTAALERMRPAVLTAESSAALSPLERR